MRPSRDVYFLKMAALVSSRATCQRRAVGCVLVDSHNHVLSTGYNGVPQGIAHCWDVPCAGVNAPSGKSLEKCMATHAEQNALLQCKNTNEIGTVYCTHEPCIHCAKLLMNTGASRVVFANPYPGASRKLWEQVHPANTWQHRADKGINLWPV